VEIAAPAKLNLDLRITGRRDDGYHELQSLFVPVDWADEVALEVAGAQESAVRLELSGTAEGVPADETNLAVRAARCFLERAGLGCRVRIRLAKRVPAAAGLGGGSSDAGAVLRALAGLFPGALPPGGLAEVALSLGADVPFFLDPRPARVSGIGERIEPLAGVPRLAVLLANPGVPLSTAEVFAAHDALAGDGPSLTASGPDSRMGPDLGHRRESGPLSVAALAQRLHNDLEAAAVRLCPPIARLREQLLGAGSLGVGLSGSGPTLFALFEDERGAAATAARVSVEAPGWARVAWTLESR
jgi:4-diphosphocytidyl-2-C-methyl-D-erythritol kinase